MATAASSPSPPDSESDPDSKPIIILVSPYEVLGFHRRYAKLLTRLRREARLIRVTNSDMLDSAINQYEDDIHGIIVTDASIMQPAHEDLSQRLASILTLPFNDWAVLFAFDFPLQVAGKARQFSRYMRRVFQLDWKISGVSVEKVELELRPRALQRLGSREYRWEYEMRAVFLRRVQQDDKILIVKGSPQDEEDDEMDDYGTECDYENENGDEDWDEDGYEDGDEYFEEENDYENFEDDSTDSSQSMTNTNSNGPFRRITNGDHASITDSPVVWHEFRDDEYYGDGGDDNYDGDYTNEEDDNEDEDGYLSHVTGYLGFVGHVEDERQLVGLILGMCAIVPGIDE
ncbi:hypothetical protein VTN00DRAFT_848 [Thermoascus crustaceus]|uniref:uncharacterized protein n=1 Tax=Thermoascus crustaceus TaxID=5088 RepID=UPI0037444228